MDEEFTLDFTGVASTGGGFDPIPTNWYKVEVTGYSETEIKNSGKLKVGTPGTNWEFTVAAGEFENSKVWTNHWHAPSTLGFMKALMEASGAFEEGELDGPISVDDRERVVGQELWLKIKKIPPKNGFDAKNDVAGYKKLSERQEPVSTVNESLLP